MPLLHQSTSTEVIHARAKCFVTYFCFFSGETYDSASIVLPSCGVTKYCELFFVPNCPSALSVDRL